MNTSIHHASSPAIESSSLVFYVLLFQHLGKSCLLKRCSWPFPTADEIYQEGLAEKGDGGLPKSPPSRSFGTDPRCELDLGPSPLPRPAIHTHTHLQAVEPRSREASALLRTLAIIGQTEEEHDEEGSYEKQETGRTRGKALDRGVLGTARRVTGKVVHCQVPEPGRRESGRAGVTKRYPETSNTPRFVRMSYVIPFLHRGHGERCGGKDHRSSSFSMVLIQNEAEGTTLFVTRFVTAYRPGKGDRKSRNITKRSLWHVYPPEYPTPACMSRPKRVAAKTTDDGILETQGKKLRTLFCLINHTPPQPFQSRLPSRTNVHMHRTLKTPPLVSFPASATWREIMRVSPPSIEPIKKKTQNKLAKTHRQRTDLTRKKTKLSNTQ
ncbi:hypothetical protein LZ30DRAFT_208780 [Colletotrichum cereale]|nr:hypothetical protein LZ30DRAFT_208780 [Colletotrichum cereale]